MVDNSIILLFHKYKQNAVINEIYCSVHIVCTCPRLAPLLEHHLILFNLINGQPYCRVNFG